MLYKRKPDPHGTPVVSDTRKMAAVPLGFMGSKVVLGCLIGFGIWGVWKLGQHLGICDVIFEPFSSCFCGVAWHTVMLRGG